MTGFNRVGSEFLVNTATLGHQLEPRIVPLSGGGFVIIWKDASGGAGGAGGDSSGYAIKAQLITSGGVPVGAEILVNTTTLGDQHYMTLEALPNGGFVVAWTDGNIFTSRGAALPSETIGGDGSGSGIRAQVFASDGSKVGAELEVTTTRADHQLNPQIVVLADGGFAIAWDDRSENGGFFDSDIRARMYTADGIATGGEILVNTHVAENQYVPMLAPLANGGFVAVWSDFNQSGDPDPGPGESWAYEVKAQMIGPDGARIGAEILVNTTTRGDSFIAQVESLAGGGFVVTWCDIPVNGTPIGDGLPGRGFRAQVFTAAGERVGGEIIVDPEVAGYFPRANIAALSDGGFVLTWNDWTPGMTGSNARAAVKAQVFTAEGARLGSEIIVDDAHGWGSGDPDVHALPDGGFLVSWTDTPPDDGSGADRSAHSVKVRAYTADGTAVSDQLLVNTATVGDQWGQVVGVQSDGTVAVIFMDHSVGGGAPGDGSGYAIKGQIFSAQPSSGFVRLDGRPAFLEGAPAVVLDMDAGLINPALASDETYAGAALILSRRGGARGEDLFGASGRVSFEDGGVLLEGVSVGSVSQANGVLSITFNDAATADRVDAVLRALTYQNTSDTPSASMTIDYAFNPGPAGGVFSPGSVTIAITPVNDAPVVQGATAATDEDVPASGQLAASDVDSSTLTFAVAQGPAHGSVAMSASGAWIYTPDDNYAGEDSFTVVVSDGSLTSTPALVTLTIHPDLTADVGGDLAFLLDPDHGLLNAAERSAVRFTAAGIDADVLPADALVTFTDRTGKSITVRADGGVADLSSLADGSVTVVLSVADDSDNSARTPPTLLELDTTSDTETRASVALASEVLGVEGRTSAAYALEGVDLDALATVTFTSSGGGSVVLTGRANGSGTVDLSALEAGALTVTVDVVDTAGNRAQGLGDQAVIDLTAPTVIVTASETDNDGEVSAGEVVRLTFTFSEAVTGLTDADIQLPTGAVLTPGSLRQSDADPAVYTATATFEDSGVVAILRGAYADKGGNAGNGGAVVVDVMAATETGTSGRDVLSGGKEADILVGGSGSDRLQGGGGDDKLYGGADSDVLFGGSGDDLLVGGTGDDVLAGGQGADRFVFSAGGFGRDVVVDFSDGDGDLIDLRGAATSFSDLVIVQVGHEVEIRIGADVIVLDANDARTLDASDFLF